MFIFSGIFCLKEPGFYFLDLVISVAALQVPTIARLWQLNSSL